MNFQLNPSFIRTIKTIVIVVFLLILLYINFVVFNTYLKIQSLYNTIGIIIIILIIYSIIRLILKNKNNKLIYHSDESDFHIKDSLIEHIINDDSTISHSKRMSLVARRNGLTSYKSKFNWSGGEYEIKSGINIHSLYVHERNGLFDSYEINFNRTLKKGDQIIIEIIWALKDINNTSVPYISTAIFEPTLNLKFILEFKHKISFQEVVCEERLSFGGVVKYSQIKTIPSNKKIEWEIVKPKYLHYYEIRWV